MHFKKLVACICRQFVASYFEMPVNDITPRHFNEFVEILKHERGSLANTVRDIFDILFKSPPKSKEVADFVSSWIRESTSLTHLLWPSKDLCCEKNFKFIQSDFDRYDIRYFSWYLSSGPFKFNPERATIDQIEIIRRTYNNPEFPILHVIPQKRTRPDCDNIQLSPIQRIWKRKSVQCNNQEEHVSETLEVIEECENMSVENINAVQKQVLKLHRCKPITYNNSHHMKTVFKALQSLRKDEVLCDIRIETDDGTIVFGHKVVLVTVSPYFRAMFTSFPENNKDHVTIRDLDSTILQLLLNYIYTGEIMVTEENVKDLLPAANVFLLDYVKFVCIEFLQTQLNPSNCLGIKALADLHDCNDLLSCIKEYIKKQFMEIIKYEEFLTLSSEELIKLISNNDLNSMGEDKVFECVINWVNHDLDRRNSFLPELMEHVRLPLASKQFILEKVVNEPLLLNNHKCNDYVSKALQYIELKSVDPFTIPQTIQSKPRQSGQVILVLCWSPSLKTSSTFWYNPTTNLMQIAPKMIKRLGSSLCVLMNQFVWVMGGVCTGSTYSSRSVEMLDLSLQPLCWVPKADLLVSRSYFGVGVIDNCIYAVGGYICHDTAGYSCLNSAEVFDINIQQSRMISSMSIKRTGVGVGVLDNQLYVVGGDNGSSVLRSVERYNPSVDTWTPIAKMSDCRSGASVAVLGGVLFVIGGHNGSTYLKSVEAYSPIAQDWTSIPSMHVGRYNAGAVELDGLLYVFGGINNSDTHLQSVEIYNPNTNTWSIKSLKTLSNSVINMYGAVVVNKPPNYNNNP